MPCTATTHTGQLLRLLLLLSMLSAFSSAVPVGKLQRSSSPLQHVSAVRVGSSPNEIVLLDKRAAIQTDRRGPFLSSSKGESLTSSLVYKSKVKGVPRPSSSSPASATTTLAATVTTTTTTTSTTTTTRTTTITSSSIGKATPTTTTTVSPKPTSGLSLPQQLALNEHNRFRALHGIQTPMVWNSTLAAGAQKWANQCVFQHSQGALGPWGENLSAMSGTQNTFVDGIVLWENEAPDYNPSIPVYSHFTQMVWKASTELGCAVTICPPGSIFPIEYGTANFYVCEYNPPGNVYPASNFLVNVQP